MDALYGCHAVKFESCSKSGKDLFCNSVIVIVISKLLKRYPKPSTLVQGTRFFTTSEVKFAALEFCEHPRPETIAQDSHSVNWHGTLTQMHQTHPTRKIAV